ncbi:MAG: hypothetical protein HKP39_04960 [Eudoraea sp.]|nr:hypothetical protein [Eudoraea sp.]
MNFKTFVIILFLCITACTSEKKENSDPAVNESSNAIAFEKEKWAVKEGEDYPFREQMLADIVYNDTVRTLNKDEILGLLGAPNRTNEGHLYYMIEETRLGSWTLHSKTLVIKIAEDSTIEWIKIHE